MISANYMSKKIWVLAELTLLGSVYRYSNQGPVDILDAAGKSYHFHGGLATGVLEESIELWSATASPKSYSIQIYSAGSSSVSYLLQAGLDIYTARVRICVWDGESTYDDISRVAYGFVNDPVYGTPDAPESISFTVSNTYFDKALVPGPNAYCRTDSFTGVGDPDDDAIGSPYPIVIGSPGRNINGSNLAVQPAIRANLFTATATPNRIIIAGHRVTASSVKITASNNITGTCDVAWDVDEYGNTISYADLSTFSGTYSGITNNPPTWVGWLDDAHPGLSNEGIHRIGDLVVWCLSNSTVSPVDWENVYAMRDLLNKLGRVDTWINDRVSPYVWLTSQVLQYLPVYMAEGGNGIYVGLWKYEAKPSDAEYHIDTSKPGFVRAGAIAWTGRDSCASAITVSGAYSAKSSTNQIMQTWTGDILDDSGNAKHPALAKSLSLFGAAEVAVDVPTIQDSATLNIVGAYQIAKYALPKADVAYYIPWRSGVCPLGAVVTVTDSDYLLESAIGIVTGIRWNADSVIVRVSLLSS